MSYLLDKKLKRSKYLKLALGGVALFFLVYFHSGIFYGFSVVAHTIFRPVIILGNGIGGKFSNLGSSFSDKETLLRENEELKSRINSIEARVANYNTVLDENVKLKEILGRKKDQSTLVLANILSKPNQSLYDTLVLDVGAGSRIQTGDLVFAFGSLPIGRIDTVYDNSSKVILFSSSNEKTNAVISGKDIFVEAVGRGGGNFEILLPRDFLIEKGAEVTLPGINSYLLGIVEDVISDQRDSFQKILITSPVNIQELKFVEVGIN